MQSRSKASRPPGADDHKGFPMYLINSNTVRLASSTWVHRKLINAHAPRRFGSRRAAGDSLPVAMDKAPPWLKTPNTRHTATGTPQAPLPFSVQSTTATVGTLRLMNSQAPEAKTTFGQVSSVPGHNTYWLSTQTPNTFDLQERPWMFAVLTGHRDF